MDAIELKRIITRVQQSRYFIQDKVVFHSFDISIIVDLLRNFQGPPKEVKLKGDAVEQVPELPADDLDNCLIRFKIHQDSQTSLVSTLKEVLKDTDEKCNLIKG